MTPRLAPVLLPTLVILGIVAHGDAGVAASPTLEKIRSSGTLTLGYREASIPFSYLGADQKPVGLSLDLCAAVAQRVRTELRLPARRRAHRRTARPVRPKSSAGCG